MIKPQLEKLVDDVVVCWDPVGKNHNSNTIDKSIVQSVSNNSSAQSSGHHEQFIRDNDDMLNIGNENIPVRDVISNVAKAVVNDGYEKEQEKEEEPEQEPGEKGEKVKVDEKDASSCCTGGGKRPKSRLCPREVVSEDNEQGNNTGQKRVIRPPLGLEYFVQPLKTRRQSTLDKRLLVFIRKWRDLKNPDSPGEVLVQCDGLDAFQRDCYGVLLPNQCVRDGYIRMAASLYTKSWKEKEFVGKSRCMLLTPNFAVFVPVLDAEKHWWCVAFDVKGEMIWVIDSMYTNPIEKHAKPISELIKAMDVLMVMNVSGWEIDKMAEWGSQSLEILEPRDQSCGVIMLTCIKLCACRFVSKFGVGKLENARVHLVLDDAMSQFNERKRRILLYNPNSSLVLCALPYVPISSSCSYWLLLWFD